LKNKNETLNKNYQTLNNDYQTLNNDYQTLKWNGMVSIGILILVLIVILVYTLTSKDSNIHQKLKVKDQVKVRNTNQQKWRIGEVVQALMVRVDGWEKAHTWNYVEKVAEDTVTERQDEQSDDVPNEDSLLCSSMSNSLEKSTTNESNSESLHTMNTKVDAPDTNTKSRKSTEGHEEKSNSLSFTEDNEATQTNTQSTGFNTQNE